MRAETEGESAPAVRKNVLFIAIDDLRPELGCYGVEHAVSPHLDAFAETAALFEQHFVQAPSCGPSRASLLTGRTPRSSGRFRNASLYAGGRTLSKEPLEGAQTMPELFRRNGYRTVQIGKISHTPDGRAFAYDGSGSGDDELPHAWDELATPIGEWGRGWGAFFAYANGAHREDGSGRDDLMEFKVEEDDELPDGLMAQVAARKLVELGEEDQPFLLAVGFFKPHLPFVAPRADLAALEDVEVSPPAETTPLPAPYGTRSAEFFNYKLSPESSRPLDAAETQAARRAYLACVRYVDRQVGAVLQALESAGLAESTTVVIWGDHGWHLGESATWGKHTLFDRSLQSALLVRVPGVTEAGSRVESIVTTLDLYPTLIELCELKDRRVAFPLEGVSLVPVLEDPSARARAAAIAYWGRSATVRTPDHRLIATRTEDENWENVQLYRTSDGPDPVTSCAETEPEVVEELLGLLQGF